MKSTRQSSSLYRTGRWLQKRQAQLATEPLCRYCAALGKITAATVADHIEPHNDDPAAFWANELQSLCAPCHDGAKQELERTGRLRGGTDAGEPVDPRHPWNNP